MTRHNNKRSADTYPPRIYETKLCELMGKFELTDNWLAMLLGVTPTTANRIKNGVDLKLSHALKISAHFKIPVEKLWRLV
jgi:DNA-binding XRE family transcriptional regulator